MPCYLVIFLIVNFVLRLAYVDNSSLAPDDARTGVGMITDPGQLLANLTLLQTYFPKYLETKLATFLDVRPIRYVGEISLSAYLWHFPMLLSLGRLGWMAGDTLPGMLRNIVVLLTATILAATVTYYLIEKPGMNYAKRFRAKKADPIPSDPKPAEAAAG